MELFTVACEGAIILGRVVTIYVDNRDTSKEAEELVSGLQDGIISDEDLKQDLQNVFPSSLKCLAFMLRLTN